MKKLLTFANTHSLRMGVFYLCFCFLLSPAFGNESIDALIEKGYQARSSDINGLSEVIIALESENELSVEQSDHLQYLQAYFNAFEGNYKRAIEQFKNVEQSATNINLRYRALITLVNVLGLNRKYKESYIYLNKLEKLGKDINSTELRDGALIASAYTYLSLKRYSHAKEASDKLLKVTDQPRNKCIAVQILLDSKFNESPDSIVNSDVLDAIQLCKESKEPLFIGLLYLIQAEKESYLGNNSKSLEILLGLEELVSKVGYHRLGAEYYYLLSKMYYELDDSKNAKFNAEKVTKEYKEAAFEPSVLAYKLLADIYQEEGNFELSNQYLKLYIDHEKEFLLDLAAKESAYQNVKYEVNLKNSTIDSLHKENKLLELEQQLSKEESEKNKLFILLLLSILVSLVYWTYRVKRNQVKFKRQSEVDVLTSVCSRHHFYMMCNKTLEYSRNNNKEVSFVLFDMDSFKSVNDNYGHLVGDWVLEAAIAAARPHWRQNDIAGRLGGEEFALMLPTCELAKAKEIAENCRKAIEAVDTSESGHLFNISASFGVTTSKVSGYELQDLIGDADKVMYQAKAAGKNQVLQVASQS